MEKVCLRAVYMRDADPRARRLQQEYVQELIRERERKRAKEERERERKRERESYYSSI